MCFIPVLEREHDGKTSQDLFFLLIFLSLLDFQLKQAAVLAIVFLPLHFWFLISKTPLFQLICCLVQTNEHTLWQKIAGSECHSFECLSHTNLLSGNQPSNRNGASLTSLTTHRCCPCPFPQAVNFVHAAWSSSPECPSEYFFHT